MGSVAELDATTVCGSWLMASDKKLSDDIGPIMKLQGLGWLMRKAISAATIIVNFSEPKDESSDANLTFDTTLKGIYTLTEKRILDWSEQDHTDDVFGEAVIRSHLVGAAGKSEDGKLYPDVEMQSAIQGNSKAETDAKNHLRNGNFGKGSEKGVYVHDYIRSKAKGWTMEQIWTIENINGKPCLTRFAVVTKGSEFELRRCAYSFMEPETVATA